MAQKTLQKSPKNAFIWVFLGRPKILAKDPPPGNYVKLGLLCEFRVIPLSE